MLPSMRSPSWRAIRPRTRSRMDSTAARHRLWAGSLIPSPFDPRLILRIAPAVAKAAMQDPGVATQPIAEFRRVLRLAAALRVPLRPHHEAGVCEEQDPAGTCDLCRGRGRARASRDQVVLEEQLARPIWSGGPPSSRRGSSGLALPSRQARISTSSIPRTIHATGPMCRPISTSPAGAASRRKPRARWFAPMRP